MKKIYYLAACDTCSKIMADANINEESGFTLQDIRSEKITPAQLDDMRQRAGSYEKLFSRRALKYKELGLKDKQLSEADYRDYILQHDTFLKRPVVIVDNEIFIGSDKKTVEALKAMKF